MCGCLHIQTEQLKQYLKNKSLPQSGAKRDLVSRVLMYMDSLNRRRVAGQVGGDQDDDGGSLLVEDGEEGVEDSPCQRGKKDTETGGACVDGGVKEMGGEEEADVQESG